VVNIWAATTADPATINGIERSPFVKDGFLIAAKKQPSNSRTSGINGREAPLKRKSRDQKKRHQVQGRF
jgi:hypothetical protein